MAVQEGGIHASTAGRLVTRHLRNTSCKAVALRRVTDFSEANKDRALELAARMDLFEPHRSKIPWRYEPKSRAGFRKICNLPPRLRVAQDMAKDLIRAQHVPRDHIFDWPDRGGCPGAVARIRVLIEQGYRYLVLADIRDCYQNFNPDFIYQTDLLPSEFVRATLDSREFSYDLKEATLYGHNLAELTRPRGLLQGGAASSTFLALALDDLPDHLPGTVVSTVQSDNIILACRSQRECEAAADALCRYLSDNPAGAFSLRIDMVWMRHNPFISDGSKATRWKQDFEQLGYSFWLDGEQRCQLGLSQANLMKCHGRVDSYLEGLAPGAMPEAIEALVQRELAGFPALSEQMRQSFATTIEPDLIMKITEARAGTESRSRRENEGLILTGFED